MGQPTAQFDTNQNMLVAAQANSGTTLNVASAAITANATSGNLSVGVYRELAIDLNISAVAGTTPTYQLFIDRLGADGVWYNIYTSAVINAVSTLSVNIGVGASTNAAFGTTIRVREVVGGTTPSFTRSMSIIGK